MTTAHMSSGGPWYHPVIMANAILGHRAVSNGLMAYAVVEAQIETKLPGYLAKTNKAQAPTQQTVRNWKKALPDYPEQALRWG